MKFNYILLFTLFIFIQQHSFSQEKKKQFKVGFAYGFGETNNFPFSNDDYTYEIQFYKDQFNYLLKEFGNFDFELNIAPTYYRSKHQLLNKYFVTPDEPDYLKKRNEFTQLKTMNEYALGLGLLIRYPFLNNWSASILGSIGPMYIDTETERLAKGFTFSDVLSFGLSYQVNRILFDLRYGVRHVSNAQLSSPNSGYNATCLEIGFLIVL